MFLGSLSTGEGTQNPFLGTGHFNHKLLPTAVLFLSPLPQACGHVLERVLLGFSTGCSRTKARGLNVKRLTVHLFSGLGTGSSFSRKHISLQRSHSA
jgi:hypothetical protein